MRIRHILLLVFSGCALQPPPPTMSTYLARTYAPRGWHEDFDRVIALAAEDHPLTTPRTVQQFFHAIAVAESDLNTNSVYHEPPPLGVDSIGLLQLSVHDEKYYHCGISDAQSLKHQARNLYCGVAILSRLEKLHPGESPLVAGAHYWSTLRPSRNGYKRFTAALRQLGCQSL